jgi:tetratricopeptide (TPR) repeat protein
VMLTQQALEYYSGEIRRNPNSGLWRSRRALAWQAKSELDNAIKDYTAALRLEPNRRATYNNRGTAWTDKGEYDRAMADFNEAIRLDPKYQLPYLNRGLVWLLKGQYDQAVADESAAIGLDPKSAIAYGNRAGAWFYKGQYDRALNDNAEAIRLDPKDWCALAGTAHISATCPEARHRDGAKALAAAKTACELTAWNEWQCLGTLAAAYAETGDFENAVRWGDKAVQSAPNGDQRKKHRDAVALYRQRKPYREQPKQ